MAKITYNNPELDKINQKISQAKRKIDRMINTCNRLDARNQDTTNIKNAISDKQEELKQLYRNKLEHEMGD